MVAQVVTMGEISTNDRRISEIIGTIDACITPNRAPGAQCRGGRRAGEKGPQLRGGGPAVRSLAQRAAEAAREIRTLIGSSVSASGRLYAAGRRSRSVELWTAW
ncbi:MAG: hypothetical protein IPM99_20585 [Rubrivivax sp.]|nr:hypothetical protein [Rubrivivax sp.]